MSIPKEFYMNFPGIISKQEEASKEIRKKLSNYQQLVNGGGNTISIESDIDRDIKKYKDMVNQLDNAYSNRNAPSQMPGMELDRRQKEIQKLNIEIQEIEKSFKNLQNKKYAFNGTAGDEAYQQSEEMKSMSNTELHQLQKVKVNEQDKMIDDVILDVKKGRVLAKEAGEIIQEQNKQLDQLQEDIDRLDSRMQRGIKRFENYVSKQSGCCIILILILELAAAILIFVLLGM